MARCSRVYKLADRRRCSGSDLKADFDDGMLQIFLLKFLVIRTKWILDWDDGILYRQSFMSFKKVDTLLTNNLAFLGHHVPSNPSPVSFSYLDDFQMRTEL